MINKNQARLHDTYARTYDKQVKEQDCFISDVLFGLTYEFLKAGQVLLDAGIGTGISSLPFAKAGLVIHGMDFSEKMLEVCRSKRFAASLTPHDIQKIPWPFPSGQFDIVLCCGVLHFIAELEGIFNEARRVLGRQGVFAFTTKMPQDSGINPAKYTKQTVEEFEIFSHNLNCIKSLCKDQKMNVLKKQNCFIGKDIFTACIVQSEIF